MKKFFLSLLTLCLLTALAACAAPENNEALLELNETSDFGGIKIGMTATAMQEKLGEADAVNPTNSGTEYTYHEVDLSLVVYVEQLIRRLASKNADLNIHSIKVGDELTAASQILIDNGYTRDAASGWRYNNNEIQIILLTIDDQTVVGFSAEWLTN